MPRPSLRVAPRPGRADRNEANVYLNLLDQLSRPARGARIETTTFGRPRMYSTVAPRPGRADRNTPEIITGEADPEVAPRPGRADRNIDSQAKTAERLGRAPPGARG